MLRYKKMKMHALKKKDNKNVNVNIFSYPYRSNIEQELIPEALNPFPFTHEV